MRQLFKLLEAGGILLLCLVFTSLNAQQQRKPKDERVQPESVFNTTVPIHSFDVILARPTANSITLSLLFYENKEIQIAYGRHSTQEQKTNDVTCIAGVPQEIVLENLKPDSRYHYSILSKSGEVLSTDALYFQTQRKPMSEFTFTIASDSHLDENADVAVYRNTLLNAAGDSADFHFDLGDTFMTDKYRTDYRKAFDQYLAQRYYLGLLCKRSPLFFSLGNHDGESGQHLNGSKGNMIVWANQTRKTYFPNPVPNQFFSGNTTEVPYLGLPQDYYSFEWGSALFVVLDPFLFTPRSGNDMPWDRTLGKQQYDWLKSTLANSKAELKFVFIHNLVGGVDLKGKARGGVEAAGLYEWGGLNPDGSEGFKAARPDWEMPIHALLKKYNVSAVFHGHDHLFAQQFKDGILYQCLPQPGAFKTGSMKYAEEYGYTNGILRGDAGYLRVKVNGKGAILEYVGTANKQVLNKYFLGTL
jgi:hypothetical protein